MIDSGIIVLGFISFIFIVRIYFLLKENIILRKTLTEMSYDLLDRQDTVQEQFLKFVSDSRDMAFEYIENVQNEITNIVDEITPVIINRENRNYNERDTLESTYKKLKALLPEQDN